MEPLDGNAIAGQLYDVFGAEITMAMGVCGNCGARAHMAELEVYLRAPGTVGRCRRCKAVLVVVVTVREVACVDLSGLASLDRA
jgi:hypothetical protein